METKGIPMHKPYTPEIGHRIVIDGNETTIDRLEELPSGRFVINGIEEGAQARIEAIRDQQ